MKIFSKKNPIIKRTPIWFLAGGGSPDTSIAVLSNDLEYVSFLFFFFSFGLRWLKEYVVRFPRTRHWQFAIAIFLYVPFRVPPSLHLLHLFLFLGILCLFSFFCLSSLYRTHPVSISYSIRLVIVLVFVALLDVHEPKMEKLTWTWISFYYQSLAYDILYPS